MLKRCRSNTEGLLSVNEMLQMPKEKLAQLLSSHSDYSYIQVSADMYRDEHCYSGIAYLTDSIIAEYTEYDMHIVNIATKEVLRMEHHELDQIKHNMVWDLNDEGERWEGDILYDSPCGWGVLYDKDNNIAYEGFCFSDEYSCYGRRYYSDIQRVEYEGGWCEGKRWGIGIQYDRNGVTVFEGEWIHDEHLMNTLMVTPETTLDYYYLIHNRLEILEVADGSCSENDIPALNLHYLVNLKQLKIGSLCFSNAEDVIIVDMPKLQSITINDESFTFADNIIANCPFSFIVKNCPHLVSIDIGSNSFTSFDVCQLENLPSLEYIVMIYGCFPYADLILKGVHIGDE